MPGEWHGTADSVMPVRHDVHRTFDAAFLADEATAAGVIALPRYAAALQEWEMPRDLEIPDEDGELTDWSKAFFTTVANALDRVGGGIA